MIKKTSKDVVSNEFKNQMFLYEAEIFDFFMLTFKCTNHIIHENEKTFFDKHVLSS